MLPFRCVVLIFGGVTFGTLNKLAKDGLIAAKQVAPDNALVPLEKRLKIEKCNARIGFNKPQREETYQVTLDTLKLFPCYPAFMITTEVPEICPILPNQEFVEPLSEDELVPFIQELGYSGKCDMLYAIHTVRESRAQILCGMYSKKNVDFVALLWEDFMFQADNKEISSARKEHMPYLRFTKVIINHLISKDKTIFMRNKINLHTFCDDTLLGTLKFVSKTQDYQQYRALIPDEMINQDIKNSKAYKTYLDFATGKPTPKKVRKFKKVSSPSRKLSPVLKEGPAVKSKQAKKPTKKSTTVPTSGDGVDSQPKVLDDQEDKTTGTYEGTSTKPRVPDVPKYLSESENESWRDSGDDDGNDNDSDEVTKDDDNDDVDSDADGIKEVSGSEKTDFDEDENPNLNQNDNEEE
ncbi:hypothetical protein Tco_0733014 [Tanacetum coccineum]